MLLARFYPVVLALALVPVTMPAAAQWSPGGVHLCQSGCEGAPLVVPDGAGGAFVPWADLSNQGATDADVFLQRVTASGMIAPGWPLGGLPVAVLTRSQGLTDAARDGQGGVLIVWRDDRNVELGTSRDIYAQRILADGSVAPGWPLNGAPVTRAPRSQEFALIAPDGAGGAYVAWWDDRDHFTRDADVYAQHLTAGGTVAAGWPDNGLPVCTELAGQFPWGVVPDDSGGVVVVWADERKGTLATYAQRLHADGTVAPGWAENGMVVVGQVTRGGAVADGAGGFYAAAATLDLVYNYGDELEYFVQRFTFAGTRAPGWPEGGLRVCAAPGGRVELQVSEDRAGGMLLTWLDERPISGGIYAARVLPEGVLAPGWVVDGTRVATGPVYAFGSNIAPDGTGGAYLVWQSQGGGGNPSFVQHLTAHGAVAPGWPAYGVRLAPSNSQFDSRIASDERGGAIVAWDEATTGRHGIWAQRFVMDGVVAAQVSLVSAVAEPDRVRLVWHVADALSFRGIVERRSAASDWRPLAEVNADGTGRIEYLDRAVVAGERHAYRLAYLEDGAERRTAETWVEVPRALVFALEGLRPNPAVRELNASFTLPSAAPATLELLDLAGRRVSGREVGSLGPGHHALRLGEGAHFAPGVYWLRLSQGGRALTARGVVVR